MPDVCFSSLFFCRITRCQRGGPPLDLHSRTGWQFCALGAPRKADDGADQLDYYCPASPKKWQLATSEQVVLGLRAEHLDKKQQQLAVLKKSSRAGKLQRAAAPRVGRRLNSSALFCSVVSPSALEITAAVPQRWSGERAHLRKLPHADRQRQPFNQGGGGRGAGWCLGLLLCRRCLMMAEMGGTLNSCSCL